MPEGRQWGTGEGRGLLPHGGSSACVWTPRFLSASSLLGQGGLQRDPSPARPSSGRRPRCDHSARAWFRMVLFPSSTGGGGHSSLILTGRACPGCRKPHSVGGPPQDGPRVLRAWARPHGAVGVRPQWVRLPAEVLGTDFVLIARTPTLKPTETLMSATRGPLARIVENSVLLAATSFPAERAPSHFQARVAKAASVWVTVPMQS